MPYRRRMFAVVVVVVVVANLDESPPGKAGERTRGSKRAEGLWPLRRWQVS